MAERGRAYHFVASEVTKDLMALYKCVYYYYYYYYYFKPTSTKPQAGKLG